MKMNNMKKVITILTLLYSIASISQVSIGNIEQQEAKKETPKTTRKALDSLSDFQVQANWNNYAQYLGHQFYLPPQVGKNYPKLWSTYPKKADEPFNNYYMLINVVGSDGLKSQIKDDKLYWYHSEAFNQVSRFPNLIQPVYFVMVNEKVGDTLYWSPNSKKEFIFVPYFAKQKSLYEKKAFYYEGYQDMEEKELTNRSQNISVSPNSKWICKEVTLLKYSQVRDYAPEDYYAICYVFTNDKNQSFAKTENPIYPEVRNDRTDGIRYFISEKEFMAKQKVVQQEKAKSEADAAKEKQELIAKQQEYIKKYGQENYNLMKSGKVKIGWTKEMCVLAWGPFANPSKTVNDQGTFETWRYSVKRALHFKDGLLVQFEE